MYRRSHPCSSSTVGAGSLVDGCWVGSGAAVDPQRRYPRHRRRVQAVLQARWRASGSSCRSSSSRSSYPYGLPNGAQGEEAEVTSARQIFIRGTFAPIYSAGTPGRSATDTRTAARNPSPHCRWRNYGFVVAYDRLAESRRMIAEGVPQVPLRLTRPRTRHHCTFVGRRTVGRNLAPSLPFSVMSYGPGTALIVVDMQNDFADPGGSLYVEGGSDVVSVVNTEIAAARAAGSPVYTRDWHPPTTPHFEKDGGIWPVHCVMDTWGAAFHPDLVIAGPVINKGSNGEDDYRGSPCEIPRR